MIFVTGGAGYIGSHVVDMLVKAGRKVIALDNLSAGFREMVSKDALFFEGDVRNTGLLNEIFGEYKISAVLHFAALTEVERSVRDPLPFFDNNVVGTLTLLQAMSRHGIKNLIFSSSAAVYGNNDGKPITEETPTNPQNPYGQTKLYNEQMINDLAQADKIFHFVSLRYFNVAGAHPNGHLGQKTKNATHLIKVAAEVATGKRLHLAIYGDDYATKDGTCVRDYIHVVDLAEAHILALKRLENGGASETFNVGYGKGYSVKEVAKFMGQAAKKDLPVRLEARRAGDVAVVIADNSRITAELGFKPRFNDLQIICQTALEFEKSLRCCCSLQ